MLEILTDDRVVIKACILAHTLQVCRQHYFSLLRAQFERVCRSSAFLGLMNRFRCTLQHMEGSFDLTVLSASQRPHGGVKEFFLLHH